MMLDEVAFKIRDAFPPGTVDELVVRHTYLAGLNVDTDEDPEDILESHARKCRPTSTTCRLCEINS
jgi:hypothetical protein